MRSMFARAAVLVCVAVAATACSKSLDTDGLETTLASQLNAKLNRTGITVDCPNDIKAESGGQFDCTAHGPVGGDPHRPRDADGQRRTRLVGGHRRGDGAVGRHVRDRADGFDVDERLSCCSRRSVC